MRLCTAQPQASAAKPEAAAKRARIDLSGGDLDAPMAIVDDAEELLDERGSPWVEDAEEEGDGEEEPAESKEEPAHPPAVPSGLNAYWVRYLLRNSLREQPHGKPTSGSAQRSPALQKSRQSWTGPWRSCLCFARHRQRQVSRLRLQGSKPSLPRPLRALQQQPLARGSSQTLTAMQNWQSC